MARELMTALVPMEETQGLAPMAAREARSAKLLLVPPLGAIVLYRHPKLAWLFPHAAAPAGPGETSTVEGRGRRLPAGASTREARRFRYAEMEGNAQYSWSGDSQLLIF